jgi:hypothetical protein
VRDYSAFLSGKAQAGADSGFDPSALPAFLFPFQAALVEWITRKGRGAVFADCGLGKTPMQLVWADNVVRHTSRPVLGLTPLAVAQQTVGEAAKFGIECERTAGDLRPGARVYVTNLEKLHRFNPADFAGVFVDESSAIKAYDGETRAAVTEFLRTVPYRSLWTATAAPNDYVELGTSSEALGELGHMDMLGRFFKNDQGNSATGRMFREAAKWRFKGHAEKGFWRWVCSWARAIRKPSDLGFSDDGFALPELVEREHVIETRTAAPGMLFALPAANMQEEREERRRTIQERCEAATALVADTGEPAVIWCHLNDEADLLERLIPGARQVSGAQSDEEKEELYAAFASGQLQKLVIKPKIGAWGLNWPHCAHVVTFVSHSYEQYYQAVRRCWRFGQKRNVTVDIVATEGEQGARTSLRRKAAQADRMFSELVAHMNDAVKLDAQGTFECPVEVPSWL